METRAFLDRLRYDGLWWRKFAALGSSYGPEWWKRSSPAAIGALCFACIGANRRSAIANMRRVFGSSGGNAGAAALGMFIDFSYCFSETLERFGPRPLPLHVDLPEVDTIRTALDRGRGVIVVTAHFGNWDIAALELLRYCRRTHVVMAHEPNRSANPYVERMREDLGLNVIYSDRSVLTSLELLQALRRNEIVALQIDRLAASDSARECDMFGSAVRLPSGPFELARLSGAPLVTVFAPRVGTRHYRIHLGGLRSVARNARPAEIDACVSGVVAEMEAMIRRHPRQWFQFEPFWVADGARTNEAAAPFAAGTRPQSRRILSRAYASRPALMRSRTASRRRSRSS